MTNPNETPEWDKHTDPIDAACEQEQRTGAYFLAQVRKLAKQQQEPFEDGSYEITDCEECGNEIGAERLRIAPMNLLCVECARALELSKKQINLSD